MLNDSTIQVDCPAKLNLSLEVLAKREDGYHELETLMTAITIYDSLYFSTNAEGRIRLTCNWASGMEATSARGAQALAELPQDAENLAWKAVERLRDAAGVAAGATIRLVKRIPSLAGLGGASSNAAGALMAANRVWRLGWTRERLAELAADLGSDVPFFVCDARHGPHMAVCRGRGERIEALTSMPSMHFVVLKPPAGLSTAAVYARCQPIERAMRTDAVVAALREGRLAQASSQLWNGLQSAAEQLSPSIRQAREVFEQLDFMGHLMSGSGTSYFGVCRSVRHARRLARVLRARSSGHVMCATTASAGCRIARPV